MMTCTSDGSKLLKLEFELSKIFHRMILDHIVHGHFCEVMDSFVLLLTTKLSPTEVLPVPWHMVVLSTSLRLFPYKTLFFQQLPPAALLSSY